MSENKIGSQDEHNNEQKPPKRKKPPTSRKITFAAVGAAIIVVMMVIVSYLPLTVAPLIGVALSAVVVCDKCGIGYGITALLVGTGLGFLCGALNVAVLLIVLVIFYPYTIMCVLMRKLDYRNLKSAFIRLIILCVFAALSVLFMYLLGGLVADYSDINGIIEKMGMSFGAAYIIITIIAILIFICIDYIFMQLSKQIVKHLK